MTHFSAFKAFIFFFRWLGIWWSAILNILPITRSLCHCFLITISCKMVRRPTSEARIGRSNWFSLIWLSCNSSCSWTFSGPVTIFTTSVAYSLFRSYIWLNFSTITCPVTFFTTFFTGSWHTFEINFLSLLWISFFSAILCPVICLSTSIASILFCFFSILAFLITSLAELRWYKFIIRIFLSWIFWCKDSFLIC